MPSETKNAKSITTPAVARLSDAAAYLNVSIRTLHRLVAEGRLQKVRLGARARGILFRDLDAFLAAGAAA